MKVKCISKIRDNTGKILGYTLQDQQGKTLSVRAQALKLDIKNGKVEVVNLTLTSDNRLIDKADKVVDAKSQKPIQKEKLDINHILNMAKVSGQQVSELTTCCGNPCYLISNQYGTHHIVVIPDNVTELNDRSNDSYGLPVFTANIKNLHGVLKVIGGSNLKSAYLMFFDCEAQTIDLSSFDTSKVTDMNRMFCSCQAESIDLSALDTHNVTDMHNMFCGCEAKCIDLSSFNTSHVKDMNFMFAKCKAQVIDLLSFNTSRVKDMRNMFYDCKAQSIDLSSFDTSKVVDMAEMFMNCEVQVLDLQSFNTSRVKDMDFMFCSCKAQSIDLSSFSINQATGINRMFEDCKAQVKVIDSRILEAYNNR